LEIDADRACVEQQACGLAGRFKQAAAAETGKVARLDWYNDLSRLLIEITDQVKKAADERSRAAVA
jgi:hypothetical protein